MMLVYKISNKILLTLLTATALSILQKSINFIDGFCLVCSTDVSFSLCQKPPINEMNNNMVSKDQNLGWNVYFYSIYLL